MVKNIKSPVGDFRDWEMIVSWVTAVAQQYEAAAGLKPDIFVTRATEGTAVA